MGSLMRAHDWTTSPIGHPDTWPQALRSAVSLMLPNKQIMFVAWGPELAFLYNDAYRPVFGKKHPSALGRPFREIWSEVWDEVAPLVDTALGGEATWSEDLHLVLERNGYPEDCWFTFSYSPARDESGKIAGLFCAAAETTQRVLADRRLAAENERQRRLFEHVPGFVAILRGPDHVFEYVNDAYDRVAGKRGFVGQTVRTAFPELEGTGMFEALDRAFATGAPYVARDVPLNFQRTPGAEADALVLSFTFQPTVDERGEVTGIFLQGQDVTREHQALAAVLAERDRQLMLLQQMPGFAAVLAGPDHIFEYVNDAYVDMAGPRNFIGRSAREVFPELEGQGFFEMLDAVQATGAPISLKAAPIRFAGKARDRFVDFVYQPVRNAAGEVTGIFVGGYDITERIRGDKARVAIEARVDALNEDIERSIIERADDRSLVWKLSPDLLGVLRADGHFETTNPAWKTTLGWNESEIISMSIFEMLHPEDVERTREAFNAILAGNTVVNFENRYRCKDGGYRTLCWVAVPERDKIYCIGRDITGEKVAAEKLSVAEAALRQSQKMEAVGQLTGGIAHDFNNMLTGVIGGLDIVRRRMRDGRHDDVDRFIDLAYQSAERAATLTMRLLAFSRRQSLESKILDVNALASGLVDLLQRTLGESTSLTLALQPDLWPIEADAGQMENCLLNLAINARDAMPDGGALTIETINVTLDAADRDLGPGMPPGDYVRISVCDEGIGMSQAVMDRAFDPFFTTKAIGQGTGLGLSMIYGFVKQSNGHVAIASVLGEGTRIKLWLPRALGDVAQDDLSIVAVAARPHAGTTVMIVEDEPSVRLVIGEVLTELGYDFVEAANGDAALPILRSGQRIDLLVSDVGLPGMNGRQLAEMARAIRPGLKVLFLTGYAEGAVVRGGFLDEGMDMVAKPFSVDVLAEKIPSMVVDA